MSAGYSSTPLAKKLGFKPGFKILIVNGPDYYYDLFNELPDVREADINENNIDLIHLFSKDAVFLKKQFPLLQKKLDKNGVFWVSWPKKASKVPTSVDEAVVRHIGLTNGLVDTKICAVDNIWSGLKFVFRKEDR